MECPESIFGNAGPNVRKIKKNKVKKAMPFDVGQIALEQIKACYFFALNST